MCGFERGKCAAGRRAVRHMWNVADNIFVAELMLTTFTSDPMIYWASLRLRSYRAHIVHHEPPE